MGPPKNLSLILADRIVERKKKDHGQIYGAQENDLWGDHFEAIHTNIGEANMAPGEEASQQSFGSGAGNGSIILMVGKMWATICHTRSSEVFGGHNVSVDWTVEAPQLESTTYERQSECNTSPHADQRE